MELVGALAMANAAPEMHSPLFKRSGLFYSTNWDTVELESLMIFLCILLKNYILIDALLSLYRLALDPKVVASTFRSKRLAIRVEEKQRA